MLLTCWQPVSGMRCDEKPFHLVQLHSITEYGHFSLSKIIPHHTFKGNLPHWFPHADSQRRLSSQFPGDWSDCSQNSDSRSVSEKICEHVRRIEWLSTIHTISRPTQINKGLYYFPIAFFMDSAHMFNGSMGGEVVRSYASLIISSINDWCL